MTSNLEIATDARGVVTITLNRPEVLNAFDEALITNVREAFESVALDPAVRLVVLTAAGRVFCAGADIGWMQRAAASTPEANLEDARHFAAMMRAVGECPKPVLARVQGPAFGGGVGLICGADVAIASEQASFSVSEARFGILPAVVGPYLAQTVGVRQARRLALTCARIGAQEALSLGLVHQVIGADELDGVVAATVEQMLVGGPSAQAAIKSLFGRIAGRTIDDEIRELTAQAISRQRTTAESAEGFAAFLAKRPASWVPG